MKAYKTNEYDIRAGVVRQLLKEGWKRENIRIEIPLDTASSGGRADIVCLDDKYLGCIELKSGKDKFCNDSIGKQCKPYRRAFDCVAVVMDSHHLKKFKPDKYGFRGYPKCNGIYHHETGEIRDYFDTAILQGLDNKFFRWKSGVTSPLDMACLLWKKECDEAFGVKETRCRSINRVSEEWALKDIRPKVIEQLRGRVLNSWEEKFWNKFDNKQESLSVDMNNQVA